MSKNVSVCVGVFVCVCVHPIRRASSVSRIQSVDLVDLNAWDISMDSSPLGSQQVVKKNRYLIKQEPSSTYKIFGISCNKIVLFTATK